MRGLLKTFWEHAQSVFRALCCDTTKEAERLHLMQQLRREKQRKSHDRPPVA